MCTYCLFVWKSQVLQESVPLKMDSLQWCQWSKSATENVELKLKIQTKTEEGGGGVIKRIRCSKQTGPRAGLLLSPFNAATKSQRTFDLICELSPGTSGRTNSQPGVSFEVHDSGSVVTLLLCSQTSPRPPHFVVTLKVHFRFTSGLIYQHMSSGTTRATNSQ